MGGKGSGRFLRPDKKLTTNESLFISSDFFGKYIKSNQSLIDLPLFNTLDFISSRRGGIGSIGFKIEALYNNSLLLNLEYTKISNDKSLEISDSVPLQTTFPHFGGIRFWFTCKCGKRVGKLYLPPGEFYFKCLQCHDLTYLSCQESHKWDNLYRDFARKIGTDFETVREVLNHF